MMIYRHIHMIAAAACLLVLSSCRDKDMAGPLPAGGIEFGNPTTKALLGNAELKTYGTMIKVWDFIDDAAEPYIDDAIMYNGETVWQYTGEGTTASPYPWTAKGIHNFMGWVTEDADSGLKSSDIFPGLSFNKATRTLNIPETQINTGSEQFDFLYTGNITRDASDASQQALVPLELKHLFTAFAIRLENASIDLPVTLHSARIEFPSRKKASIVYKGADGNLVAEYVTSADNSVLWFSKNNIEATIPVGAKDPITGVITPSAYDLPAGKALNIGDTPEYYISWPLTKDEASPSNPVLDGGGNPTYDEDGYQIFEDTDKKIVLEYSIAGIRKTTRIKLPAQDYVAGRRYLLTLNFVDKQVILNFKVLDWDYNENPVSFENEVVTTTQALSFIDGTYNKMTDKTDASGAYTEVLVKAGGSAVQAKFKIITPVGGTLRIGPVGDTQFFSISPEVILINPEMDGGEVTVSIRPKTELAPYQMSDVGIGLKFSIESMWHDIDATESIQGGKRYRIVWPK